jgi:D-3-phosphoglycerate dehydrogenase
VAEYCFAAIFCLLRKLNEADEVLRAQDWGSARQQVAAASELAGRTLGIVGVGKIGRRVAAIGGTGFGMKVIGATRTTRELPAGIAPARIDELFSRSDVIVLSCPLSEETRGLVNAKLLHRVKPTAILINVSRGAVIDQQAFVDALRLGRLAGAALDVFTVQPLRPGHPFFDLPNVLLTPHLAGLTRESMVAMSVASAREMLRILSGARPENLVNPEIYA